MLKALSAKGKELLWEQFCQKTSTCQIQSCGFNLARSGPKASEMHLRNHFRVRRRTTICRWASCGVSAGKKTGLLHHLSDAHGIPFVTEIMGVAQFCHECSEVFTDESVWEDHCSTHLLNIDIFCGQVVNKGVVLFARKCVFCLGNTVLCAAQRYRGYTNSTKFFEHLGNHIDQTVEWPFRCPHPNCTYDAVTPVDFWQHLQDTHGISRYGTNFGEVSTALPITEQRSEVKPRNLEPVQVESAQTRSPITLGQDNSVCDNRLEILPEAHPPQSPPDIESTLPEHLASPKTIAESPNGLCEPSSSEQNSSQVTRPNIMRMSDPEYTAIDPSLPFAFCHPEQVEQSAPPCDYRAMLDEPVSGNQCNATAMVELEDKQASPLRRQPSVAPILPDTPQSQPLEPMLDTSRQSWQPLAMAPTSGRPCPAPGCNEVFRLMRELTHHTIEAHNQSPYTCETCGKLFRDGSRLREHGLSHHGPLKRLTCNIDGCRVDFGRSDTLRRHQRKQHAEKGA